MRTCDVEGCDEKHYGRGWCKRHYSKARNEELKLERREVRKAIENTPPEEVLKRIGYMDDVEKRRRRE